jgi:hypothetical protein
MSGESINRMIATLGWRAGLAGRVRAHGLRQQGITELWT